MSAPGWLLCCLLALCAACQRPRVSQAEPPARNLLFVVVDAWRVDALALYGNPQATNQRLGAHAGDFAIFEAAWAQGTYTQSSFLSYMTSSHPRTHGWDFPIAQAIPASGFCGRQDLPTLAEVLAARGFTTTACVNNRYLHPKWGFARGFERWNRLPAEQLDQLDLERGEMPYLGDHRVARWAAQAMESWDDGQRHFLYVHILRPHLPLAPSDGARRALDLPSEPRTISVEEARRLEREGIIEEREQARAYYLGSVWDADRSLGEILDALEEAGQARKTAVVITADHGEKAFEHGDYGHAAGIWDHLVRVPLLIRAPGLQPGRRKQPVSLIDLAPTALALLGLEAGPSAWQGGDLLAGGAGPVVSQRLDEVAISKDGRWKALRAQGAWSLYDLARDPDELQPVTDRPELLAELRRAFQEWTRATPVGEIDEQAAPVGICAQQSTAGEKEALEEALRELGYVE